ncbi:MAG: hypothetical protein LBQ37_03090 [Elusimicrobiota bacterium]|jgi:biotin carboxyl carrier protein|nr:hypothetical protein [Elusimicrobiota bacterium]
MKPQEIKEILKSLRKTDIEEVRYSCGDNSLYFKRGNIDKIVKNDIKEMPVANIISNDISVNSESKLQKLSSIVSIKSEAVGTFSNIVGDNKPPIAVKGTKIKVGQKVGQVEAMKIAKDVLSKVKGEVLDVLVSNGESVEYGQDLILVDTDK